MSTKTKDHINVAIVGVGNCASSLVQGLQYYRHSSTENPIPGVIMNDIGGYRPGDIKVTAAFDIDIRKIGQRLTDAIFQPPNCTLQFQDVFDDDFSDPLVQPAPVLDGYPKHMDDYPVERRFCTTDGHEAFFAVENQREWIINALKEAEVDIIINYLPVGSQKATEFWAEICLDTGISFLNCIPVFIASDPEWEARFIEKGIPIIGDDMRSVVGASIISAVLQELFLARGCDVKVHYQDNVGGNTDFLNMQDQTRLASKKISKENVIRSQNEIAGRETEPDSIAAGPAKYFPHLKDNKRAHFLIEATSWGGSPIRFTGDLSVEDSPNSAGIVCDAIRHLMVAREEGVVGSLRGPSAATQKTPPVQMRTSDALEECRRFARREVKEDS